MQRFRFFKSDSPIQRLASSKAALQQASSSKTTFDYDLESLLHRAAVDAYKAGQFNESLGFTQQILAFKQPSKLVTPLLHWVDTVAGLDHLATGEVDLAATDLARSAASLPTAYKFAPTMALASALVAKRPDAVIAYLKSVSNSQNWPDRSKAALWIVQVQAGQTPNFGRLVHMGL